MVNKKGLLVILLLATVLVLSFSVVALAEATVNEQQAAWQNEQVNELRQLRLQQFAQINEQKQLRLQECGGVCDDACEPKQERLQKNEQQTLKRELNRQQKIAMNNRSGRM